MIEFAIGFVAATAMFVFVPDLAVIPAGWIRMGWEWVKRRTPKE